MDYTFYKPSGKVSEYNYKKLIGDFKYKKCKVCSHCFTVYQLLQNSYEKQEKAEQQRRKDLNRTCKDYDALILQT